MFIHHIPLIIPTLLPKLIWSKPVQNDSSTVFFTFDDGPTREITNFVLDCLADYKAKGSFFCIGKNIQTNQKIIESIIQAGHRIGNHTMNHANAWKTSKHDYQCEYDNCEVLLTNMGIKSVGFRPPYGRVNKHIYHNMTLQTPIFMWSFLSGDYNQDLSIQSIIDAGKTAIKPGTILVFHDSEKAFPRLRIILPALLEHCYQNNLIAETL